MWRGPEGDDTGGGPGWAINVEWIHKGGQGAVEAAMEQFAKRFSGLPGLSRRIDTACAAGRRKGSAMPARTVSAHPQVLITITSAVDELYSTVAGRSTA